MRELRGKIGDGYSLENKIHRFEGPKHRRGVGTPGVDHFLKEGNQSAMPKRMCFFVTNGLENAPRATRGLQFAKIAKDQGNEVTVVLIDDAVIWAQLGMSEGIKATTEEPMQPLIEYLLEHETPFYSCRACMARRYLSPDDLMKGVKIESFPYFVKLASECELVVTF